MKKLAVTNWSFLSFIFKKIFLAFSDKFFSRSFKVSKNEREAVYSSRKLSVQLWEQDVDRRHR